MGSYKSVPEAAGVTIAQGPTGQRLPKNSEAPPKKQLTDLLHEYVFVEPPHVFALCRSSIPAPRAPYWYG